MTIVSITENPWHGQWMNRHHLMWAMRSFTDVLYVQEPQPWHKALRPRDEGYLRPQVETQAEKLRVLRLPKWLSQRNSDRGYWNALSFEAKAAMIRRRLDYRDGPIVAYLWHAALWRYASLLRPDFTVFHVYDLNTSVISGGRTSRSRHLLDRACQAADVVIAGTQKQADLIDSPKTRLVPNGVPIEWYEGNTPCPDDVRRIPRPRIGFVGSVTDRLEFDWFEAIARQPHLSLVIIGPTYSLSERNAVRISSLCTRPNVHFLGSRDARQIPDYMRSFDVGIMNYRTDAHCNVASPIKLYEYCAAGLPIVSSPLASLLDDTSTHRVLEFAQTSDEVVAAIHAALATGRDGEEVAARLRFAAANSWSNRARRVREIIDSELCVTSETTSSPTRALLQPFGH